MSDAVTPSSRPSATQKPVRPHLVLLAAALLPGSGHVILRMPFRGLQFLFFMIVLGWVSVRLMPEHASFFAHHVGAIFIYGLSVIDAYRIARIRAEVARYAATSTGD